MGPSGTDDKANHFRFVGSVRRKRNIFYVGLVNSIKIVPAEIAPSDKLLKPVESISGKREESAWSALAIHPLAATVRSTPPMELPAPSQRSTGRVALTISANCLTSFAQEPDQ